MSFVWRAHYGQRHTTVNGGLNNGFIRVSGFKRWSEDDCEDPGLKLEYQLLQGSDCLRVLADSSNVVGDLNAERLLHWKERGQTCPQIPDLIQLSPRPSPSPFPLPLGESHPADKGLSQEPGCL